MRHEPDVLMIRQALLRAAYRGFAKAQATIEPQILKDRRERDGVEFRRLSLFAGAMAAKIAVKEAESERPPGP